uniref:Ubiquitin carboxyl-terminal hydrolase MINDY n=1 Tax=Chelonoidis abingdonii TaxID=106734 RepID=A0A8C0H7V5_CHEAB
MSELSQELVHLVWGKKAGPGGLADTIFCRWAQGFVYSESESTALEQFEGGPCAVIAPVQAFLLKKLFTCEKSSWRECQEEEQKNLLCHTLCDILEMACSDNSESYSLATWIRGKTTEETASISESPVESSHQEEQPLLSLLFQAPHLLSVCFLLLFQMLSFCCSIPSSIRVK